MVEARSPSQLLSSVYIGANDSSIIAVLGLGEDCVAAAAILSGFNKIGVADVRMTIAFCIFRIRPMVPSGMLF